MIQRLPERIFHDDVECQRLVSIDQIYRGSCSSHVTETPAQFLYLRFKDIWYQFCHGFFREKWVERPAPHPVHIMRHSAKRTEGAAKCFRAALILVGLPDRRPDEEEVVELWVIYVKLMRTDADDGPVSPV